MTPKEMFT